MLTMTCSQHGRLYIQYSTSTSKVLNLISYALHSSWIDFPEVTCFSLKLQNGGLKII